MTTETELRFTVNGTPRLITVEPSKTLLAVLREDLGLISVKEGCGQGDCGSCIVVMDGLAVNSCLVLAAQADGSEVVTLEGLAVDGQLHPLQRHFAEEWAFQCGYCTPGMIMSCYALLMHNPEPEPQDAEQAIEGNLCRCTSYHNIIKAVLAAADEVNARVVD